VCMCSSSFFKKKIWQELYLSLRRKTERLQPKSYNS
jgi:hypothetical protein